MKLPEWLREKMQSITGVSTPLLGLSWQSLPIEKHQINKVIVLIGTKRIFDMSSKTLRHCAETNPSFIVQSIIDLRNCVTLTLQECSYKCEVDKLLWNLVDVCNVYLENSESAYSSRLNILHFLQMTSAIVKELSLIYEIKLPDNVDCFVERF